MQRSASERSAFRVAFARFATVLLGCVLVSAWIFSDAPDAHVFGWINAKTAACAAWLSRLLGFGDVRADESVLITPNGIPLRVLHGCNGVFATLLWVSAILAFPSRWTAKAWGVLLGIPFVFLVNQVRVVSIVATAMFLPSLFEHVHVHVWQTLIIPILLIAWVFWIRVFARAT